MAPCAGGISLSCLIGGQYVFVCSVGFRRRRSSWRRPRRWVPRRHVIMRMIGVVLVVEVQYKPFLGYWWSRTYRSDSTRAVPLSVRDQPEVHVKRKDVRMTASPDGPSHLAAVESQVFSMLHNVVSHCSITRYDDGLPRKTGWVTIKTMGAAWVVQVKDPDGCCSMSLTAQTLDDALALADVMLGADDAPWEPDPFLKRSDTAKRK